MLSVCLIIIQIIALWLVLLYVDIDTKKDDKNIKIYLNIFYTIYVWVKITGIFSINIDQRWKIYLTTFCQNLINICCIFTNINIYILVFVLIFLVFVCVCDIILLFHIDAEANIENILSIKVKHYKKNLQILPEIPLPEECSICMEQFIENDLINILGCNHQFHAMCIQQWFAVKHNCPNCRFGSELV